MLLICKAICPHLHYHMGTSICLYTWVHPFATKKYSSCIPQTTFSKSLCLRQHFVDFVKFESHDQDAYTTLCLNSLNLSTLGSIEYGSFCSISHVHLKTITIWFQPFYDRRFKACMNHMISNVRLSKAR